MSISLENKLVVLIGGNGFVGRHLAQDLLQRGARVRIAARNPEKALSVKPLANLGQLQFARCNVRDAQSIRAVVAGADAVVYLVGTFGKDARQLHADAAREAAEAAATGRAVSFVYLSSLAADAESEGMYASTKALGERAVLDAFPAATILRPSVIFGKDDQFVSMFAGLISVMPVLPVFGPDAQLQPVWVDDVAAAAANALADPASHGGKTYELAGPDVMTMMELHEAIAAAQGRRRAFIPVPDALSGIFAALPGTPMSSDQWRMLKAGSVATGTLPGITKLGITPRPLSLFLDKWMQRFRKHGRFTVQKA
ncbi:SDR family NAD(P)-dependent oxidoreductase [Altererythrobacter lauratis]|uniref:SDR family NAD(P)-dependent oxidoreductase n=1 Tax=Alteraurantiacibacter lauratis TaxID=2054627 RepID=A0ABV7EFW6_9SPHN